MHYLPTDSNFDNISAVVEWARENDNKVQQIVRNANELLDQVLSVEGVYHYWTEIFVGLSRLTRHKPEVHPSARQFVCTTGQCAWNMPGSDKTFGVWSKPP